jgi:hypothetical protein
MLILDVEQNLHKDFGINFELHFRFAWLLIFAKAKAKIRQHLLSNHRQFISPSITLFY